MNTPPVTYLLDARKSTDDKKHQVLSLPAKTSHWQETCEREKLDLQATIDESITAKYPARPKFNRMLDRIEAGEANGNSSGTLTACIGIP
jgi:DNA invertase Pin-like site-specific DNA recombinase